MGIDTGAKNWILTIFGHGAVFTELPITDEQGRALPIPKVWVFDHTTATKHQVHPTVRTGYAYLVKFLKRAGEAYKAGAKVAYYCLDRGSPGNKSLTQDKRAKSKKKPAPTPLEDRSPEGSLLNDRRGPVGKDEWERYLSNSYLTRRLVHYVTMRLIGTKGDIDESLREWREKSLQADYDDDLCDYSPPPEPGVAFMLFGGRLAFPESRLPETYRYPDPVLIKIENITSAVTSRTDSSSSSSSPSLSLSGSGRAIRKNVCNVYANNKALAAPLEVYETTRRVRLITESPGWFTSAQLANLLEGEVSALFFAQNHLANGEDVLIETPDGDTLLMLLLDTFNRIDRRSGVFTSRVIVCLTVGGASGEAMSGSWTPPPPRVPGAPSATKKRKKSEGKVEGPIYVDVNQLWYNAYKAHASTKPRPGLRHPTLVDIKNNNNAVNFVNRLFTMVALCGTDYVCNFCIGIDMNSDGLAEDVILNSIFSPTFLASTRGQTARNLPLPWVIYTYLKFYRIYGHMIAMIPGCDAVDMGEQDLPRLLPSLPGSGGGVGGGGGGGCGSTMMKNPWKVTVNDQAFISFAKRIYVEKYGYSDAFAKRYPDSRADETHDPKKPDRYGKCDKEPRIVQDVRHHLWYRKSAADRSKASVKKNRMPTNRRLRVFARHFLWQISYWCNSYKGACEILDPTTLYKGLPFYGWEMKERISKCRAASRVSVASQEANLETYEKLTNAKLGLQ